MHTHSPTDRLFSAIADLDLPGVKAAIKAGARLIKQSRPFRPPLETSALAGSAPIFAALLAAGCTVNEDLDALHCAVDGGSLEILERTLSLVSAQACVGEEGKYTPLARAARQGRLDMCRLLLDYGADSKIIDQSGFGIINRALQCPPESSSGSVLELVELLLESGAPVSSDSSTNLPFVLMDAIALSIKTQRFVDEGLGVKLCKLLIKHGANVSSVDANSRTALHQIASNFSHSDGLHVFDPELIPFFIKSGIDVNIADAIGATPLYYAARAGNEPALRQLLALGARVNAQDSDGKTALHLVYSVGAARILLEAGADPSVTDKLGEAPDETLFKRSDCHEAHAFLKAARQQAKMDKSVAVVAPTHRLRV